MSRNIVRLLLALAVPAALSCTQGEVEDPSATGESESSVQTSAQAILEPNDYYQLRANHSGKCLTVADGSTVSRTLATQATCNDASAQRWQLIVQSPIRIQLKAQHSGLCLDVRGASTESRALVQQYPCKYVDPNLAGEAPEAANQLWDLVWTGSGDTYALRSMKSGMCLDVRSASVSDGALVQQYPCHGGANQKWTFVGAAAPVGGYDLYVHRMDFRTAEFDDGLIQVGENVNMFTMISTRTSPAGAPLFPASRVAWRKSASDPWQYYNCPADTHYPTCVINATFNYAAPGFYDVEVIADVDNIISEPNEGADNRRTFRLEVLGTSGTTPPQPTACNISVRNNGGMLTRNLNDYAQFERIGVRFGVPFNPYEIVTFNTVSLSRRDAMLKVYQTIISTQNPDSGGIALTNPVSPFALAYLANDPNNAVFSGQRLIGGIADPRGKCAYRITVGGDGRYTFWGAVPVGDSGGQAFVGALPKGVVRAEVYVAETQRLLPDLTRYATP